MSNITVQEIQRDPFAFLQRVEGRESFFVVRGEQGLAEVRPLPAPIATLRPFGLGAGKFAVPADFDEPLLGENLTWS